VENVKTTLDDKTAAEDALLDELDLDNDPVLQNYRENRIEAFKKQMAEIQDMKSNEHGVYSELEKEKDFITATTSAKLVVVHFYHKEFIRCKIVDKHLQLLAPKHFKTKFLKLEAEKAPFFVEKLAVKMLPCIICFVDGIAVDRIVGFEELGERDDFPTGLLEKRLAHSGVLRIKEKKPKQQQSGRIYGSSHNISDEDSD